MALRSLPSYLIIPLPTGKEAPRAKGIWSALFTKVCQEIASGTQLAAETHWFSGQRTDRHGDLGTCRAGAAWLVAGPESGVCQQQWEASDRQVLWQMIKNHRLWLPQRWADQDGYHLSICRDENARECLPPTLRVGEIIAVMHTEGSPAALNRGSGRFDMRRR